MQLFKFIKHLSIGTKIQIAISTNVVLAILIGEYIILQGFNLSGTVGILINLFINSIIAFIYGLFVSRAITKPLRDQVDMLKRMNSGAGDLTQRLHCKNNDEVGELATHFNSFVEHLYNMIKKTTSGIDALYASIGYFNHIGNNITEGAHLQKKQTQSMAKEINQMSDHEEKIALSSTSAEKISLQTEASAKDGRSLVLCNIEGMRTLESDMQEISAALGNLKNSVETISEIVININEISDQTNLLALNAAIEAARAGEQGRGFAVVADEVRQLAKRAGDATERINTIIENIKDAATALSEVINEGSRQVLKQVETSHQAGAMLNEIESCSQEAAKQVVAISLGVHKQISIANAVIGEIDSIAKVAESNGDSVQQVVNFSEDLKQQMLTLKNVVGEFKL